MVLQKAGPSMHSQEPLTTVIRSSGEWTDHLTANAKRSTARGHHLQSSCSPLWLGKSQNPGNPDKATVGSEHLLWPSWWTKGLVRIAASLKTQLGYHWAGLWEKNETLRYPKFGTTSWTEEAGMGAKGETGFQLRHVWPLPNSNSNQLVLLQCQENLREARQSFSLDISVSQQWVKDVCLGIRNLGHVTKTQVLPRTPSYLCFYLWTCKPMNPPNPLIP